MPGPNSATPQHTFHDDLAHHILKYYGINVSIKPFGENISRNNIFLAISEDREYIIKTDSLNHVRKVTDTVAIAQLLNDSDVICSSNFISTKEQEKYIVVNEQIVTVQEREALERISIRSTKDLSTLGKAIAEFHRKIKGYYSSSIEESDFYEDFMGNDIAKDQAPARLAEIIQFYKQHTPEYSKLSQGIAHNDLNIHNIFKVGDKYCFIDFEHVKNSPLVSDLGVIALELWDFSKGVADYQSKVYHLLQGYEQILSLSGYDKQSITVFSLRYLFSDENWYSFWAKRGNDELAALIPEVIEKQKLLQTLCK
jgi:Ser/Thr protein kinase RdoA (MazF antagonist)